MNDINYKIQQMTGADTKVKSLKDRIAQTPDENVVWSGERGQSDCYPMDMDVLDFLQEYGQDHVSYDWTGEPNFKPFAEMEVKISDMSDNRQKNFSSAYKKMLKTDFAKENGLKTIADIERYYESQGMELTWHECSDGVTMLLIPSKINKVFGHCGGVSELKGINTKSNKNFEGSRTIGKTVGVTKIHVNKGIVTAEDNIINANNTVKEKISSISATGKATWKEVSALGTEFEVGAKDELARRSIHLTAEAIRKMTDVASGRKEADEAVKEMGKTTVEVAVIGGTKNIIDATLKSNKIPLLKNIGESNEIYQIIEVANIVQEAAVKYINGQIDEREFIEEVGVKGTTMVAGMIGGEIGQEIGSLVGATIGTIIGPGVGTTVGYFAGGVVGEILGTIITTVACSAIMAVYTTSKNLDSYKLADRQIKILEKEALDEMERQRNKFREIVQREYKVWDEEIQKGFDQMLSNACKETYNLNGVTEGLDRVLVVFGKSVMFKTVEEYEAQLDMPLKLSF